MSWCRGEITVVFNTIGSTIVGNACAFSKSAALYITVRNVSDRYRIGKN